MLTVLQSIELSAEYLNKREIDSPRLNAELMLAHILNCKRLDLYLLFDRPLRKNEIEIYREMLRRRSEREPLQYILGKWEFYGLEFKLTPSALIPRQETELLVDEILKRTDKDYPYKILDIGSGSGNISISLAKYLINSEVESWDINQNALNLAAENAKLNGVENRVLFIEQDVLSTENINSNYDIIVSNPPYISVENYETLQPEILKYEPRNALTDSNDGLTFYNAISKLAFKALNKKGALFFEIGCKQAEDVKNIMNKNGFKNIVLKKDYNDIFRIIIGDKI